MESKILVLPAAFNPTKQFIFSDRDNSADGQFLKLFNFNSLRYIIKSMFFKAVQVGSYSDEIWRAMDVHL